MIFGVVFEVYMGLYIPIMEIDREHLWKHNVAWVFQGGRPFVSSVNGMWQLLLALSRPDSLWATEVRIGGKDLSESLGQV